MRNIWTIIRSYMQTEKISMSLLMDIALMAMKKLRKQMAS